MQSNIFRSIPLHVNPEDDTQPWHCDLMLLTSPTTPTCIFAVGLDDPSIDRHLFCTSMCVCVNQSVLIDQDPVAFQQQRQFEMKLRMQSSSIGMFLNSLVVAGRRLNAFMLTDDEDTDESSVLMLQLELDIDSVIIPLARSAGLIFESEIIDHIGLRFEFSHTARAAHVAALALMMATDDRLGKNSPLSVLGQDILRLICDAYRLRLFECKKHVWSE